MDGSKPDRRSNRLLRAQIDHFIEQVRVMQRGAGGRSDAEQREADAELQALITRVVRLANLPAPVGQGAEQ